MTDATTQPRAAALSVLGGMATLGLTDNFMPLVTETGSLAQFHFLRSLCVMAALFGLAALGVPGLRPRRWGAVAGRSVFPALAMLIYFGMLSVMPIGVVVAGLFTAPIWVLLIAIAFQGKRVGPARWAAVGLGTLGTYLVMGLDPDLLALGWLLALPLLAGLFYAIGAVATRAWCEGEGTMALTAGFFLMLGIFGAAGLTVLPLEGALAPPPGADGFSLRGWGAMDGRLWLVTLVQAAGSLLGIFLIFRGYQLGEASHVAVFEYSLLVFASVWAYVLWGQTIGAWGLAGMALIAVAGAVIALRTGRGA